jgi:hypothetical protein
VVYIGEGLAPINEVVENDAMDEALVQPQFKTSYAPIDSSLLSLRETSEMSEKSARASYNYSAMAAYAVKYVYNYNPAYCSFPADCTNFISQAMIAGGWLLHKQQRVVVQLAQSILHLGRRAQLVLLCKRQRTNFIPEQCLVYGSRGRPTDGFSQRW